MNTCGMSPSNASCMVEDYGNDHGGGFYAKDQTTKKHRCDPKYRFLFKMQLVNISWSHCLETLITFKDRYLLRINVFANIVDSEPNERFFHEFMVGNSTAAPQITNPLQLHIDLDDESYVKATLARDMYSLTEDIHGILDFDFTSGSIDSASIELRRRILLKNHNGRYKVFEDREVETFEFDVLDLESDLDGSMEFVFSDHHAEVTPSHSRVMRLFTVQYYFERVVQKSINDEVVEEEKDDYSDYVEGYNTDGTDEEMLIEYNDEFDQVFENIEPGSPTLSAKGVVKFYRLTV